MPDDFPEDSATSGRIAVGESVTGTVESSEDRDWFAVTLTAGTACRITVEGASTGGGTLASPYLLGVLGTDGDFLPAVRGDGAAGWNDTAATFYPRESGTFFIAAGTLGEATGTYRLTVAEVVLPADDAAASPASPRTVPVGGSADGVIERPLDDDWFAVTLEAGTRYRFTLDGAGTGPDDLRDPFLRGIHRADGTLIDNTTNDDYGSLNSRVVFTPTESGTYYVAAGGFAETIGAYRLNVATLPALQDDFGATAAGAGLVAVGGSVTGVLEDDGDSDWFASTFTAGKHYRIDVEALGEGVDALINASAPVVYGTDGEVSTQTVYDVTDTPRGTRVYLTPAADGTYHIAASGFGTGAYRLSVTEVDAVPVAPEPPILWLDDPLPHHPPPRPTTGSRPIDLGSTGLGVFETAGSDILARLSLSGRDGIATSGGGTGTRPQHARGLLAFFGG